MSKIKIFLIAVLSTFSLLSMAQIGQQRHNLAIGFNGGMDYNTVSFQPTIKQKGLCGITGGFTARYISEKYFAMICGLQIEVNLSQKGWDERFETSDGNNDPTKTYTRKITYLEIPFLAHLAFGKEPTGAQFFINAGPQIGFELSNSEKTNGLTIAQLNNLAEYNKPVEHRFDYGIAGGLGLEIRTRKIGNFLIEGRYYFGLADIFKSTKKDYFSRSANQTIAAKITYLFDLKK